MKDLAVLHFAQENKVVSAGIDRCRFTFHNSNRILDERQTEFAFKVEAWRALGISLGK